MDNGFNITFDHHPDVSEENATHAVVHYEDEWVAILTHDGFNWSLLMINGHYGEMGGEIDGEYDTVSDFITVLTKELEKV